MEQLFRAGQRMTLVADGVMQPWLNEQNTELQKKLGLIEEDNDVPSS